MLEPLLGKEKPSVVDMITMIKEMHTHGVYPTLWKVEGLLKASDWKKVRTAAHAPIVVLGRASTKAVVEQW